MVKIVIFVKLFTMQNIGINISGTINRFALGKSDAYLLRDILLARLTANINQNLIQETKALNSTRNQYLNGLSVIHVSDGKNVIELSGKLANMLEQGANAFDMKKGLLGSPKAKTNKLGQKYIHVPFRWASATSQAKSEAFANKMPKDVYEIAKQLESKITALGGTVRKGVALKTSQLPLNRQTSNVRPEIVERGNDLSSEQKAAYTSQTSIYSGITKQQKLYQTAKQSTYVSFRTVSENSAPNAFIHKGFNARDFMQKAVDNTPIEEIKKQVLDLFVKNR